MVVGMVVGDGRCTERVSKKVFAHVQNIGDGIIRSLTVFVSAIETLKQKALQAGVLLGTLAAIVAGMLVFKKFGAAGLAAAVRGTDVLVHRQCARCART
eukprot:4489235-Prymnesium_polylepis.1